MPTYRNALRNASGLAIMLGWPVAFIGGPYWWITNPDAVNLWPRIVPVGLMSIGLFVIPALYGDVVVLRAYQMITKPVRLRRIARWPRRWKFWIRSLPNPARYADGTLADPWPWLGMQPRGIRWVLHAEFILTTALFLATIGVGMAALYLTSASAAWLLRSLRIGAVLMPGLRLMDRFLRWLGRQSAGLYQALHPWHPAWWAWVTCLAVTANALLRPAASASDISQFAAAMCAIPVTGGWVYGSTRLYQHLCGTRGWGWFLQVGLAMRVMALAIFGLPLLIVHASLANIGRVIWECFAGLDAGEDRQELGHREAREFQPEYEI